MEYPELEETHIDHPDNSWPPGYPKNAVPEGIVQALLELHEAKHCKHFPEERIPVSNQHLGKELFPNTEPKPPLTQLRLKAA